VINQFFFKIRDRDVIAGAAWQSRKIKGFFSSIVNVFHAMRLPRHCISRSDIRKTVTLRLKWH